MNESPFSAEYQPTSGTGPVPVIETIPPSTGETTSPGKRRQIVAEQISRDTSEYFLVRPKFDPIRARLIIESDDDQDVEASVDQ
jgi:hypothetical protein